MGALTIPMFVHGVQVASGDVLCFDPRGISRLWRRSFLAIADVRDRSIPYLVRRMNDRVHKLPLDGSPYSERAWRLTVFRLPGIDKARASGIASRAAERPGEGVHHPSYDCGRECKSDAELVRDAYAAAGVTVTFDGPSPGSPLAIVTGPQDPPNEVVHPLDAAAIEALHREGRIAASEAERLLARGIPKTLDWQKRTRR